MRPDFNLKKNVLILMGLLLFANGGVNTAEGADRPNVLFVAIDDLNDWVSVFGGHPAAKTPHVERFANEGATVFQNAHGAGSVCGPSRSAMLSGFMPHRTGIYGNKDNMLDSTLVQQYATLPEYFSKHGYHALTMGKIYHRHDRPGGSDPGHWAFDEYNKRLGGSGVDQSKVTSRNRNLIDGKPGPPSDHTGSGGSEFAWGPTKGGLEETQDYRTARWAAEQLQKDFNKPFFMAVGLSRPHLPFYVPQEFFDLYPRGGQYAPPINHSDLDDILNPRGAPQ
ncbi:MAG: sulfatase-like hydrolase/transferase, partial [Planctomycetota bacterium]